MESCPILESCTQCRKDLRNPKTLPCLHSFCFNCIDDVIKEQSPGVVAKETNGKEKNKEIAAAVPSSSSRPKLHCPQCHSHFELPKGGGAENLPVDPFVQQLVKNKEDRSLVNPNNVECVCEDERATVHCASCDVFIGESCLILHKKSKATAHHVLVPIDGDFAESPNGKPVHHCPTHPSAEIDLFCKTCSSPICAYCVVPGHLTHDCVNLTDMDLSFSNEIMKCLEPIEAREKKLREAILLSSKTIEELNKNAQTVVQDIKHTFATAQEALEQRKNILLSEAEAVRFVKEKRLRLQKEGLEFFAEGMRSYGEFAKGLVGKGGQMEVAMSKNTVMSRFSTLQSAPIEEILHEDSTLRFGDEGKDEMLRVIHEFGSISGNQTSSKTSTIEWESSSGPVKSMSVALNAQVSFKIISVNKEGERITRGGDDFLVDLADNSKTQAEIVDHIDGSYSVSLVPTVKGSHRLSVTFAGEDIQGSPFDLLVDCASAKTSYLEGSPFVTVNQSQEFKIVAVEEDGTPAKQGGEIFTCSMTINDQPQAPPVIADLHNGTYQLKVTPTTSGQCSISVKLNGEEIKGSPTSFDVSTYDFFGGPKKFQMLYDATVHGYSNKTFHDKCDNINGTVTLVTLQNGAKFGGYNAGSWGSAKAYKHDPGCFLFSLTDGRGSGPQKFVHHGNQHAIYCRSNYGPTFGNGHCLYLQLDSPSSSYSNSGHSYALPSQATLAGSYSGWAFANVQVFQVI